MDVRLNRLLNSAERLIQDKKEPKEGFNPTTSKQSVAQTQEPKSDFAVSLPIQYHNIQSKLTELQKQLSREQARHGVLEDNQTKKEDLIKILFGNEPLFPELAKDTDAFSREGALTSSQGTINALMQDLKKKEVEGENIFSLGMILSPEEFNGKVGNVSSAVLKPISETVVKRLLGG